MIPTIKKTFLTAAELAETYGCTPERVRQLRVAGILRAVHSGKSGWLYPAASADRYFQARFQKQLQQVDATLVRLDAFYAERELIGEQAASRGYWPLWPERIRRAIDGGQLLVVERVGSIRYFKKTEVAKLAKRYEEEDAAERARRPLSLYVPDEPEAIASSLGIDRKTFDKMVRSGVIARDVDPTHHRPRFSRGHLEWCKDHIPELLEQLREAQRRGLAPW